MPKLGESVTEGTIGTWFKAVGDAVELDDVLFDVSTDKVDSEIPSPYDGMVLAILVEAGETVPVGTVLARIGAPGSRWSSRPGGGGDGSTTGRQATAARAPSLRRPPRHRWPPPPPGVDACCHLWCAGSSPRAESTWRRFPGRASVGGSGARTSGTPSPQPRPPGRRADRGSSSGCGPGGGAVSKAGKDGRDEVIPLSRMRLILADTLKASQTQAASVWTSVEVDFDNIERVRTEFKARFKKETGASLSYLPFISRAVCDALRQFPTVNSSIDLESKTMTLHPYVNLGVAVDLDEQGLVVPVVKDADTLNIRGIASQIATKAAAARAKELPNKEMQGSTFTITNPGPFSSYASSPIINQPNVAILCTDGVKRRPVAVGDAIAIHPVGIIGMVYDHRAFDGSTASKFLLHLRDSLEQRDWSAELS